MNLKTHDDAAYARFLLRTLGARAAGGYLRNRGWSIEAALHMLFSRPLQPLPH